MLMFNSQKVMFSIRVRHVILLLLESYRIIAKYAQYVKLWDLLFIVSKTTIIETINISYSKNHKQNHSIILKFISLSSYSYLKSMCWVSRR